MVVVQVAVVMVVLLGFAALTIDVGAMYNTRADLQRAADAAALAGASVYTTDDMMAVRMGTAGAGGLTGVIGDAVNRSSGFSYANGSFGTMHTNLSASDILTGWINPYSGTENIHTSPEAKDYNAVQLTVRRQAGEGDATNGPVEYLFAKILGQNSGGVTASAAAMFDDRFAGVRMERRGAGLLPFTIHEDAFAQELAGGGDQYAWDSGAGAVSAGSDGVREVRLYPYPLSGSGYEEGDGNFGVLNIGTGNQGVDAEIPQILNGVSTEDMEMEIGTSTPTFVDQSGSPTTYDITGSPGLEATLKAALSDIIGQEVGFFLHNDVVLSGSNATYSITQIRYGRVMAITLTGPPNQRGLFIQPISYTGDDVIISEDAPSSGGLVGRLVIVR